MRHSPTHIHGTGEYLNNVIRLSQRNQNWIINYLSPCLWNLKTDLKR
ncbi:unnamed protein product [Gulo gulo]|uniref:Uncharacterized protein n=1 Tax=Gulo gulo TaxID=48420 RepID=A0A9X9LFQ4_GULGU|nr:unnamed protein product [Gulo gulo]